MTTRKIYYAERVKPSRKGDGYIMDMYGKVHIIVNSEVITDPRGQYDFVVVKDAEKYALVKCLGPHVHNYVPADVSFACVKCTTCGHLENHDYEFFEVKSVDDKGRTIVTKCKYCGKTREERESHWYHTEQIDMGDHYEMRETCKTCGYQKKTWVMPKIAASVTKDMIAVARAKMDEQHAFSRAQRYWYHRSHLSALRSAHEYLRRRRIAFKIYGGDYVTIHFDEHGNITNGCGYGTNDSTIGLEVVETYGYSAEYNAADIMKLPCVQKFFRSTTGSASGARYILFLLRQLKSYDAAMEHIEKRIAEEKAIIDATEAKLTAIDNEIHASDIYKIYEVARFSDEITKVYYEYDPYDGYFGGHGIPFDAWVDIVDEKIVVK